MVSRLITRTVLFSIISALVWTLRWTWTADFPNIYGDHTAQRVVLMILESSVLLAALSLLFESLRSFGTIAVKRDSWTYVLSGLSLLDENRETSSINARTCKLFGARSFILSMFSMFTAMCLTFIYQIGKVAILFFLNPHVLTVDWSEVFWVVGLFVGLLAIVISLAFLFFAGQALIEKKVANRVAVVLVLVFYWSIILGLAMGTFSIFDPSGFKNIPVYLVMLSATGTTLALISFIGTVLGLGYAIYKIVGKMSQRFPVLGNVWNQLCPVQMVHFTE